LKSEDREYLDVDQLFKEAGEKAAADIKIADDYSGGVLEKTAWHWFGGVLHIIGLLLGDVIYYGSAIWVGTNMLRSPF
jgi:hypothetical protein